MDKELYDQIQLEVEHDLVFLIGKEKELRERLINMNKNIDNLKKAVNCKHKKWRSLSSSIGYFKETCESCGYERWV